MKVQLTQPGEPHRLGHNRAFYRPQTTLMLHRPNRKRLLLAGLFLTGLLCSICTTRRDAGIPQFATAISAKMVGQPFSGGMIGMETQARSDHIALLKFCLNHYQKTYHNYTCLFQKQERLNGILGPMQEINVNFMDAPYSVSMHWIRNQPSRADRLLYVEGMWNNQMIVRPSGWLAIVGPQFRDPCGDDARKVTLNPVNTFGFERTLRSLIKVYEIARKNGDLQQEFGQYAKVDGRDTLVLVRYLPCKPEYPGWKTLTYIDLEYLTPIMLETYGWDERHLLTYRYVSRNVKFNVGLAKEDFLPQTCLASNAR